MNFVVAGLALLVAVLTWAALDARRNLRRQNKRFELAQSENNKDLARKNQVIASHLTEISSYKEEISRVTDSNSHLGQRISAMSSTVNALTHETISLQSQINLLEQVAAASAASGAPDDLWRLELARSERTWRHSVATSPEGPSPFEDTNDSLRLAVEIEAAALREDVGAYTNVDWRAEPVEDPTHRHRVLRVAQELLNEAARDPHPVELLAVTEEGAIVLSLLSDHVVGLEDLAAPVDSSELIQVETDQAIVVTVR